MIVSDNPPFIYARVPKTGSTSVSKALGPYGRTSGNGLLAAAMRRLPLPNRMAGRFVNYRANPHMNFAAARIYLGATFFDRALKFTVVRHPVDRLISLHKHILRYPDSPFQDVYPAIFENPGFEFFVDWLQGRSLSPQVALLVEVTGEFLVDRIVRLERLDEELKPVTDALGVEIMVPRLNVGDYTPPDLSAETLEKIETLYAADYHHLGYRRTGLVGSPVLKRSDLSRQEGALLAAIGQTRYDSFLTYPAGGTRDDGN